MDIFQRSERTGKELKYATDVRAYDGKSIWPWWVQNTKEISAKIDGQRQMQEIKGNRNTQTRNWFATSRNQSINQLINESMNQWVNQPLYKSTTRNTG